MTMNSIRRISLFFALLIGASTTTAMSISSVISGADMVGMGVTATFADASTETAFWQQTGTDASVPLGEGFSGAATSHSFVLSQQGFTLGNIGSSPATTLADFLGVWTLTSNSTSSTLTHLRINAWIGGIVFDNVFGAETTPGSANGREYQEILTLPGDYLGAASYSQPIAGSGGDLFGILDIAFQGLADGDSVHFWADTDAVAVPEPATFLLFALGFLGLLVSRSKRSVTNAYEKSGSLS
jgi:hypothetical protein